MNKNLRQKKKERGKETLFCGFIEKGVNGRILNYRRTDIFSLKVEDDLPNVTISNTDIDFNLIGTFKLIFNSILMNVLPIIFCVPFSKSLSCFCHSTYGL